MKRRHKRYEVSKILLKVSQAVSSSLEIGRVSEIVLEESMEALGADNASLFLVDESSGRLILTKAKGFSKDDIDNIKLLGSWEVITNQLMQKRKPILVNDVKRDPLFNKKNLPFFHERMPIQSFMAVPLKKDHLIVGALIVSNKKRPGYIFTKKDEELLLALSSNIAIALLNAKLYQSLKKLFLSTVASLTKAIDAKDRYTSGHSERVMKYAVAIGHEMKLNEEKIENLRLSALLHDIGKIGIKESILTKPAKLLGYEISQIHRHPIIGAAIVESVDNSNKIVKGILEHHERFDGKGYPNRIKGRAISLEGRIIAVADTYDALTKTRIYQVSQAPKEVLFEIKRNSSTQFDPKVVRAFMLSFSKHSEIWM